LNTGEHILRRLAAGSFNFPNIIPYIEVADYYKNLYVWNLNQGRMIKKLSIIICLITLSGGLPAQVKNDPGAKIAATPAKAISKWEKLRFGAFVHFNDNSSVGTEISKNTNPGVFNPVNLNFDSILSVFSKAGIKYAVLTTRHTSGFCLWDSKTTVFDVAGSPFRKDVVRMFTDACRKYRIKPCFYYCLWGGV
jgi:alpha-L-fucosidase